MKFEDQRKLMVQEQIITRGINNEKVINALLKVPRHLFVPADIKHLSYQDSPLSIGNEQTISQPYIVALMMQLLEIKPIDKILEIGTGSGYQTALLAEMCDSVYTIERIDQLSLYAQKILLELSYKNIYFKVGDGTLGWKTGYPICSEFNKIIVTAAAPDIPQNLLDQMADNGLMIIPAGNRMYQELILVKREKDKYFQSNYGGCAFVPLIGKEGWKF